MATKNTTKNITKSVAKARKAKAKPYVIVRCRNAGVHAGEFVSRKGQEVTLHNSRRIWYWSGAATLSELAVYGAKNTTECKFGVKLPVIEVLDACEIIACQPEGETMIRNQPEWRA